jgi:hypothetical protein
VASAAAFFEYSLAVGSSLRLRRDDQAPSGYQEHKSGDDSIHNVGSVFSDQVI